MNKSLMFHILKRSTFTNKYLQNCNKKFNIYLIFMLYIYKNTQIYSEYIMRH